MRVRAKNEIITQNTSVTPDGFGGWRVVNLGSAGCTVNGMPLRGNTTETYNDTLDFTHLDAGVIYDDTIKIAFTEQPSTTQKLLLTRLYYKNK